MVLSPHQLWENYNRSLLPLDVSEISSHKEENHTEKKVYFNGETSVAGCTRIYARYLIPTEKSNKAVIILSEPSEDISSIDFGYFINKGWSVIAVDYAGNAFNRERFTIYPPALEYANFNSEKLYEVCDNPQKTCHYMWTTVCLRAVTFAESEGYDRVSLIGSGVGGAAVYKASAVCDFPCCAVTVFSPGFFPEADSDSPMMSLSVSLDVSGYSQMIKIPFLQLCCSNESDSSLDNISELMNRSFKKEIMSLNAPSEKITNQSVYYIAPRVGKMLTCEMKENLKIFLSEFMDDDSRSEDAIDGIAPKINLTITGAENRMYFSLKCESNPKEAVLYVSHGINNSAYRNWRAVTLEKAGEYEYIAYINVYSADSPIYVFAVITSESGFKYCSNVIKKIPSSLKITPVSINKRRLIYDSDMLIDDFFTADRDITPVMKEGPFSISGICAKHGLCTYKIGDALFSSAPDGVLQLLLYSPVEQTVEFSVIDGEQYNTYTCSKTVTPATDWTKILLPINEFKSNDGVLTGWDKAIFLKINSEEEIILSSLLWV